MGFAIALVFTLPHLMTGQAPGTAPRMRQPTIWELLGEDPILTTGLADARTEIAFLDDFDPQAATSLCNLPRGPRGGFLLVRPGVFQLRFQSYCLQEGMYGPSEGDGFLYAPLRGSHAGLFRRLLTAAGRHGEVKQRGVQSLLWDLLGHPSLENLEEPVAKTLLSAEDRAILEKLVRRQSRGRRH